MGQCGGEKKKKRVREDMTVRGLRVGLREPTHTKCLIRVKSSSVSACEAERSTVCHSCCV